MNPARPTFFVDAMLGRLATWLRLMGYDTKYDPNIDDDDILRIAEAEHRVLLTSDRELYEIATNRGLDAMLVRGSVDEEVARVFLRFGINPVVDPRAARCSKCNGPLLELRGADKERVRSLVHTQTFEHYDVFWLCTNCKSVYFQGGYWDNILRYLARIREIMQNLKD